MRNIVIVLAVVALLALGWLAFSSRDSVEEPVADTESTLIDGAADTSETELEPAADEAPDGAGDDSAETVAAESDGVPDSDEQRDAMLRLANAGGAKQPVAEAGRYRKDKHFVQLSPTQPKVTGTDKIEVVEVFWYGCGHCYAFDPHINEWAEDLPADVEFVRLPAIWNETLRRHARAFYTAEVLAKSGDLARPEAFHKAFFDEIHVNGKPLASDRSLRQFFERFGVAGADYDKAAGSFEVDQKVRTAMDLTRRYGVTGVPALVVNGRYRSLSDDIRGWDDYLGLVNALVEAER